MRNLTYTLSPHPPPFAALTDPQKGVKGRSRTLVVRLHFQPDARSLLFDGLIYNIRAVRFN